MKTIYTYTLLVLFSLGMFSTSMGQCTPSSPTEVPSGNILAFPDYTEITFSGAAGHDYFTFEADTSYAYIFSTHSAQNCQIFNVPNNDLQVTIQDSLGNPIAGKYGQSFQDDYDLSSNIYEPFMVWAPTYKGKYRMVLTKYHGGTCQELAYGDSVKAYFLEFKPMNKFAIYHEIHSNAWATTGNWVHYTGSGAIQNGKPANLKDYFVLMNGYQINPTSLTTADSCKALCIMSQNIVLNIPAQRSFEVFDTLWNGGQILGDGDLIIHKSLEFTYNIGVKEVILKGDASGSKINISQYIGNPYYLDTLTIDNAKGVEVEGDFRVKWVKFNNGKVEMAANTILLYQFVLYITSGHSGASSQSYVLNTYGGGIFGSTVKYLVSNFGPGGYEIPVGSNTHYRPIKIDLITSDSIGVEVFYGDSAYNRLPQDSTLSEVSSLEYWDITLDYTYTPPGYGPPEAKIGLSWDNQSGVNSSELVDLRVAGTDLIYTKWLNLGQNSISSSGNSGWIYSAQTDFEKAFTFAAVNGAHALPIEALAFSSQEVPGGINLSWSSPTLLQGTFMLEKSLDGNLFESIQHVSSPDKMMSGSHLDASPFRGFNYYRIKHIDLEGVTNYSHVIQEYWAGNKLTISCFTSRQKQLIVTYQLASLGDANLEIIDLNGRMCFRQAISADEVQQEIDMSTWASGVYVVQVRQGGTFLTQKIKVW